MRHKQTGTQYIRALFLGVSDEVRYKPGPDLISFLDNSLIPTCGFELHSGHVRNKFYSCKECKTE